ncbi:Ribosomal RNA small subunit methyltransferase H [Polystyrenella longa]|uniref:Ribosomal RNA small subunit methyltransferase H n=2 Tax=Polystyrenella longa TaxID=2528007 RepID=A0A518CNR2_9PLAN|nr:Ribosomal RNA small subunit methyltransferase H [Polystyrenella longa]
MPPVRRSKSAASTAVHQPVMLREVLRALELRDGLRVVDGTVGAAGHSVQIRPLIAPNGILIGTDRDPMMLEYARINLEKAAAEKEIAGTPYHLCQGSYALLPEYLKKLGLPQVDRVLLDLGLSSDQLADGDRGFSFHAEGPLDLRFDTTSGKPASEWLQEWSEEELVEILENWGEEKFSRQIAAALVAGKPRRSINTASDLVNVVMQAIPVKVTRDSRKHPATRVFQALRIAVNEELRQLEVMLDEILPQCLATDGLAVIITFHSLEDRMVKNAFKKNAIWTNLTPKPIEPTRVEQKVNPRSRSAKVRVARRIPS